MALQRRLEIRQPSIHPSGAQANAPETPAEDNRRRRRARHQRDLPGLRATSRVACGRSDAAGGDLHRLVIQRRADRSRSDGRAVEKAARDVALICEPRANNTAENAVRSLQLLQTIEGGSEVIAVCPICHFPRVRFFFDQLYKRHGYSIGYRSVVSLMPSLRLVLAELSSITRMARD